MAVAIPRQAPAEPRRRPAAPKQRPVDGGRSRTTAKRASTLNGKATIHRSTASRASVGARPFRIAAVIATVGVILSVIVYLHVASLRATMQAGELRAQVEQTQNDAANVQAQTEQRLADGRVERAAAAYGMVLVPSEAMQTLKIRIPKDLQTN
ncbi:MAG: hypothetical protein ACR2J9_07215 [Gaiellales bacterium]